MKKNTQSGNLAIWLFILITIGLLFFFLFNFYTNSQRSLPLESKQYYKNEAQPPTTQPKSTQYYNENFNYSLNIPDEFSYEEGNAFITLIKSNQKIEVSTIGTNFDTIGEYFNDISIKNKLTYKSKENLIINGKESLKTIRDTSEQKEELTFWIYHNYSLFFISTTDKELYSTTEEVAKSIRFD